MALIRTLDPELAEVAAAECHEKPEEVAEKINTLREWIKCQTYLTARTDDQFLVAFLRFCKYDMDATKKRFDYYYTYKTTSSHWLKKDARVDDKIMAIATSGIFATLPKPIGAGGPRIHYTRMGLIDCSKFSVHEIFRFHMFRSEIEINTDDNWIISGVVEIIDFGKIPFALLRQFEPSLFRKMSAFLEYGIPTNLVATHIVNASKEAQLILGLVRNVMKQKELLHIHPNVESLQKTIGKEYLPVELGGNNGTLNEAVEAFEKQLISYNDYFVEDLKYGVDEGKRKNSPTTCEPANSGTFRKLDID